MNLWFLLIGCGLPIIMISLGTKFLRYQGNDTRVQYRTVRSTMNIRTWKYAHKVCGKTWAVTGKCLLAAVILLGLVACRCSEEVAGQILSVTLIFEILLFSGAIFFTELALKKYIRHFTQKEGRKGSTEVTIF